MPSKVFALDEQLFITVTKRKTSRNLRLSIAATGEVRVSIPLWAPYQAGVAFARTRQDWIRDQVPNLRPLQDGQAVGKAHHLLLLPVAGSAKITSRIGQTIVKVGFPPNQNATDPEVQKIARKACIRALRDQSEGLLPQRLASLAEQHNFRYHSVSIKRLKGRWGSCDQNKDIVLNLFLMQLPWHLIDYVLLHELTHTEVMRHGPDFWAAMEVVLPQAKQLRKDLKTHQPVLG